MPGASGDVEGDGPDSIPAILARAMNTELTGMIGQALGQKRQRSRHGMRRLTVAGHGRVARRQTGGNESSSMDLLGATGAIPVSARVVDDGNLVTGGGVTSGLDVALYLLERELGPRVAHVVERLFEFERRGTVWRETGIAPSTYKSLTGAELNIAANKAAMTYGTLHEITQASVFDGDWDTTIATPVGKLQVKLSISTSNGTIQGKATQGDETVEFLNSVLQDNKLTWSLRITKPMRLNLKFEVAADGDHMTGIAKAGVLPASKLTGKRAS